VRAAVAVPLDWEILAIIERRAEFWTAAALRRFFDGSPKIEFCPTPGAILTGFWKGLR
jgi:hypothetical protein